MARDPRLEGFIFEPRRFLNAKAVQRMSLEARGAYIGLFCSLWDQPDPGVVIDDDRILATLARCTPEEWDRVGPQVRAALDERIVDSGRELIQTALRETYLAQAAKMAEISSRRAGAAKARWLKPIEASAHPEHEGSACKSNAGASPAPMQNDAREDRGRSGVGVGKEEAESKHSSSSAPAQAEIPGIPDPQARGPIVIESRVIKTTEPAGFLRFWEAYPRKIGRAAALALWRKKKLEAQTEEILTGLERWKLSRRWREGFVMDGDRFIRRDYWRDAPDDGTTGTGKTAAEWAAEEEDDDAAE